MNVVFLSPHYPPNFRHFCINLKMFGAQVFGLADEAYENLHHDLRWALTEYYRVYDMQNYDQLLRALGYFTYRFGKLDRIDSQNEFWLETEARLRTDFNIPGLQAGDMAKIKRKSEMKKMFIKAGVAVARGLVPGSDKAARAFAAEVGFPIIAKPDIGVGANATYKINNQQELDYFLARKLSNFILEEFVSGQIITFDGLTDQQGNIVFYSSLQYSQGIMEAVNQNSDLFYYTQRQIPEDLEIAGRKIAKVYNLRERFFHFEFFRKPDGALVALEVNMRPPGGLTVDMMNYANDIDLYREWANIIVNNRFEPAYSRPYHCCYVGRRWHFTYQHKHQEIEKAFPNMLIATEEIPGAWSVALGNMGYLLRSSNLDEILEAASFIQAKA